jgi:hypothetical protein
MDTSSLTIPTQIIHQQDQVQYQILNLIQILNQIYRPYLITLNSNSINILNHLISLVVFTNDLIDLLDILIMYFIIKI